MINKKIPLFLGLTLGSVAAITAVSVGYVLNMNSGAIFNYYANPTSDTPIGTLDSYKTLAKRDAEIIMAAGFLHSSPIKLAFNPTNSKTFKDIGFILLDEILSFGGETPALGSANTASASFRSDLGSFQTAISSAILLNKNQEYFIPENFDDNPSTPRRESFK
jgi:basic membrane lipoprotein Med (substrate-binding protein (PBP1-ABC) superfamily)